MSGTTTTAPPSTPAEPAARRLTGPRLARMRDLALVPAIIVLVLVGALIDPVFLSSANITNVLQQQTELSLLVLAEAIILIGGRFDLSLESTVGLAPALGVALVIPAASNGIGTEWSSALAIPICLLVGLAIGAFNGLLILRFGLSAFIVTLGMLIVLRGLQIGITGGQNLFELPESVLYLGNALWLGLPASIWICAILFAIGIAVLGFFRHGRAVYAIGGNRDAARAAGIRADRVMWIVFIVGGVLAALAGLLMTGRLGSVAAAQGDGMIFTVFAAAVIGGVSMEGGKGTLFGALCGVIVLGLINNILTLAGVSAQWIQAIYGLIILVALMLARLTTGKAQD
ncbi:simple sugar transport system permease protein/ribose transport system permease protein [Asanoa ferruginea]|uniref:Simple sugar transport system permease protein/ribose transport system permease protein n=1 Tax=Asanoa ferruginea TaxID=53367 RepID=A0A3D9ZXA7_9ACTN|nr:ABC transporter permease [Asanoa ferruginea]REF98420.1 simple sugar transport system permease protein/ribose transport system permease protein [Asanoa ferruginea]GIF53710.1 sugar ABC transporter permease [Asanoa ferruginea]